jgi:hypothetical protein
MRTDLRPEMSTQRMSTREPARERTSWPLPVKHLAAAVSLALLSVFTLSCSSAGSTQAAPSTPGTFTLQLQPAGPVLTVAQRTSLSFTDGPPDGTLGVLLNNGTYSFYGSALSNSSCSGTPGVQGTYRLGGSFTNVTAPYGCTALIRPGGDPNGYTFDVNYAGGGPVLAVTSASGQSGVLHIYHGEFHGGTCGAGTCTYASLGMAISKDGGATFQKLGEIVQPYATRNAQINAGTYTQLGGGTLILADANGNHIANVAAADPSSVYLYVFYYDADPSAAAPCDVGQCLAVARAQLSAVLSAAFASNTAAFPTLFTKFYNNGWTQPATSGDPNAATNSGHYTPVIAATGAFPSVLYDNSTQQYLIAYAAANHTSISMQHGASLLSWSGPISTATITDGTNALLYPTLVGEGSDPTTSSGQPWLFYLDATTWPDWQAATIVNRRLQLSLQ